MANQRLTLRTLRHDAVMTQGEVAAKLNVTQSAVCKWETGAETPLKKYHQFLCSAYNCTREELQEAIKNSASVKGNSAESASEPMNRVVNAE